MGPIVCLLYKTRQQKNKIVRTFIFNDHKKKYIFKYFARMANTCFNYLIYLLQQKIKRQKSMWALGK